MGQVYRAEDTKLGREVAIKVLPDSLATDPERLERFEREARTVAALKHPHIVTIYSVEEADGLHFLTMELVDGVALDSLIAEGQLDLGGADDDHAQSTADSALAIARCAGPISDAVAAVGASGLLDEIETPLVRVLARMEHLGIEVDVDALRAIGDRLRADWFPALIGSIS